MKILISGGRVVPRGLTNTQMDGKTKELIGVTKRLTITKF